MKITKTIKTFLLLILAIGLGSAHADEFYRGRHFYNKAQLVIGAGSTINNAGTFTQTGAVTQNAARTVLTGNTDTYNSGAALTLDSGSTITFNGTVSGLDNADLPNRSRYLQLGSAPHFVLETSGLILTGATDPTAAKTNNTPTVNWAQGSTAKAATTFRVPPDYVSGGAFLCTFSLAAASADTTVDFEVFVNATGVAFDASATDQTPVAKSNNTTQVQDLTLTVATDTFAAGNTVTFNIWRAAGTGASSTLSLYNCAFVYTADM